MHLNYQYTHSGTWLTPCNYNVTWVFHDYLTMLILPRASVGLLT